MTSRTNASATAIDNHNDSGDWLKWIPEERFVVRIFSSDVNERYTSVEIVAQGSGPPLHIHHNEDEHFIILEGTVRFARGAELFDASAGETVTIPRGVKHAWAVRSGMPARMLLTFAPGGFEEAFRALAVASLSEAESILARYGCTIEGPPL